MELHLEVKVVGKGPNGRTACGSSAYRSCDKVIDNAGNVHNFRNKRGHVAGGIELPEGASEELLNRETLWQRHELKDVRKDAELFREVQVTFPNELDYDTCVSILKELSKPLTEKGMCIQWDVHDNKATKTKPRNLHAHLMITMRELNADGTFGNKNRSWNKYNGGLNIADMLRPEAARLMNEALEAIGSSKMVEHESYIERGIDKIPQKHMGAAATAMERRGIKTNKGNQNRYIDWLNHIHAENLRQAEELAPTKHLDDLITKARAQQDGAEVFKDWDALFAMLRDTRRCRAALKSEQSRIEKFITAFEEGNTEYLKWAGCDPNNSNLGFFLQKLQDDLRIKIKEMDVTEDLLLDNKDLFKYHNKVVYVSKKIEKDEIYLARMERRFALIQGRLDNLNNYLAHIEKKIGWMDILLNTKEFQEYQQTVLELHRQRGELWQQYYKTKDSVKQQKKDLKEHKKELKKAKKEERHLKRQQEL